jgi:hypothetical protein
MRSEGFRALPGLRDGRKAPKPSALPTMEGDEVWFSGRLGVVFGYLGMGDHWVSQPDDTKRGTIMKTIQVAALISLTVGSMAFGQQAVQWKVSDGGNGHWYQIVERPYGTYGWNETRQLCLAAGGDLASFETSVEWQFMRARCRELPPGGVNSGQLLAGGLRNSGTSSQWEWLTGSAFTYFAWNAGVPNDGTGSELVLCVGRGTGGPSAFDGWDDWRVVDLSSGYVIEWSADCNNDGIVDFGQCKDGSLLDLNGNNIPDCCETGTTCSVPPTPKQWRVQDGGNGHWYSLRWYSDAERTFGQAQAEAAARGGHLATVTSSAENEWVKANVVLPNPSETIWAPSMGGRKENGAWTWVTGEPWSFTDWGPAEPTGDGPILQYWRYGSLYWNDHPDSNDKWLVEWSADCNNDGIVDYGQILTGQLADSDNDGIPNVCECDCDVFRDFSVNGIDLGILLGQWGASNQFTVTDFNGDGVVDGSDLGQLLASWGPCPN